MGKTLVERDDEMIEYHDERKNHRRQVGLNAQTKLRAALHEVMVYGGMAVNLSDDDRALLRLWKQKTAELSAMIDVQLDNER